MSGKDNASGSDLAKVDAYELGEREAAIEIERCNAGSNNLKDDKDERDRNKRKPDPV